MPWNASQSLWHAWGGEAPAALAAAGSLLGDRRLVAAALDDAGVFTPQLLTSGGPYNAWSPMPGEAQIAYGAESRVAALLAAHRAGRGEGFLDLAGIAGGWFFGANPAGQPAYDPATGVAVDGIEPDGRVNRNSGAESTIHALLAMLALDAHPRAAALASSVRGVATHDGLRVVEAESGQPAGAARVVTPASAWNGEANLSGGAYVSVPAGASVTVPLTASGGYAYPVINQAAGPAGTSRWYARDAGGRTTYLGRLANGGVGAQGITAAPGRLAP